MNWGHWIIIAFVAFAGIIISMVTISMRQDISLVEKNYYEEELAYEDQIDRLNNYTALEEKPVIGKTNQGLTIDFPSSIGEIKNGSVHLYRPSQAGLDKKYQLSLDESRSVLLPTKELKAGLWKLKLRWSDETKEYYYEDSIIF